MRNEAEVRAYRDAMEWALSGWPAGLDVPDGLKVMAGHLELVKWLMGEPSSGVQDMVNGVVENVRKAKECVARETRRN